MHALEYIVVQLLLYVYCKLRIQFTWAAAMMWMHVCIIIVVKTMSIECEDNEHYRGFQVHVG